jgi:hypothetical protein
MGLLEVLITVSPDDKLLPSVSVIYISDTNFYMGHYELSHFLTNY